MKQETKDLLRDEAVKFGRSVTTIMFASFIIVGMLFIVFRGASREEARVLEDTKSANLAIACVLSLPVDPETGRDEEFVKLCFTQHNLEPPILNGREP